MLTPELPTIIEQTGTRQHLGVLHIGAHLGEEVSQYVNAGIKHALWVEANPHLMKSLYENTKFHPIKSQYLNSVLAANNNDELIFFVTNDTEFGSVLPAGEFLQQNTDVRVISQIPVLTKKFETVYRENNSNIDMSKFDLIRISTNGTELEVLKGFGNLFQVFSFKTICITNFESSTFKGASKLEEIDQLLLQHNFTRMLLTPSDIKNELVYTRNG